MSERALSIGIGLYSKVPEKSVEQPSGVCADTMVAAAKAERATAYFMVIVLAVNVWGM